MPGNILFFFCFVSLDKTDFVGEQISASASMSSNNSSKFSDLNKLGSFKCVSSFKELVLSISEKISNDVIKKKFSLLFKFLYLSLFPFLNFLPCVDILMKC